MSEYYASDPRLTPRELSGYARVALELRPQNAPILEQWFPNITVAGRHWSTDMGTTQDFTSPAQRRAFNTPPRVSGRPAKRRLSGSMAPLGEKKVLLESEIEEIQGGQVSQDSVDTIFDDVTSLVFAGRARMEIDRASLLENGQLNIVDENGLWMEADFKRKAARSTSVATAFDDPASNPIADEKTFTEQIRNEEGARPQWAVAYSTVIDALRVHQDYRDASTEFRVPTELSLDELNDVRRRRELPQLIEYEALAEGLDGVLGPVVNPNKILYLPQGPVGLTQWGRPVIASEPGVQLAANTGGPVVAIVRHANVPVHYENVMDAITMATLHEADQTGALEVLGV